MKHISFLTLIIACIYLSSLEAMELQTTSNKALFTFEEGKIKVLYTDAYWDYRRVVESEAAIKLITHMQNEYNFKQLLALEQKEPQEARWGKIEPLLGSVGAYLSINAKLRKKLFKHVCEVVDEETNTVHQQTITYDTWLQLVNPDAYKAYCAQNAVPPLPPLPPLAEIPAAESNSAITAQQAPPETQSIAQEPLIAEERAVQIHSDIPSTVLKKRKNARAQKPATPNKKAPAALQKTVAVKKGPTLTPKEAAHIAFWHALCTNKVEEVKSICSTSKINLDMPCANHTTPPLHRCVAENYAEMLECLLELGAKPNTQIAIKLPGKQGWIKTTPLSVAIQTTKINLIQILLKYQADPNICAQWIPSRRIEYPLNTAIAKKTKGDTNSEDRKTMAALLLRHGATKFLGEVYYYDTSVYKKSRLLLEKETAFVKEQIEKQAKLQISDTSITIYAPE